MSGKKGKNETGRARIAQWQAFADRYVALKFNASQAYIEAGFKVTSTASAASAASRLLNNVKVRAMVEERLRTALARQESTPEQVVALYKRLAEGDLADLYDPEHNTLLPIHEMPRAARDMISGVKTTELYEDEEYIEDGKRKKRRVLVGYTKEVKVIQRVSGNDGLAKIHGMFRERRELTGKDGGPIEVTPLDAILHQVAANGADTAPGPSQAAKV